MSMAMDMDLMEEEAAPRTALKRKSKKKMMSKSKGMVRMAQKQVRVEKYNKAGSAFEYAERHQ